jgi:hypothetical protein
VRSNGDLSSPSPASLSSCKVSQLNFDCQVTANNSGCQRTVDCPLGQKIIGATAACNLEYGTISDGELASLPTNHIKVIRASDHASEGSCWVGSNSLQSRETPISGIDGLDRVTVGCKEHDENGGDCHIKGILYCGTFSELKKN